MGFDGLFATLVILEESLNLSFGLGDLGGLVLAHAESHVAPYLSSNGARSAAQEKKL
jgi:hypothetical protein